MLGRDEINARSLRMNPGMAPNRYTGTLNDPFQEAQHQYAGPRWDNLLGYLDKQKEDAQNAGLDYRIGWGGFGNSVSTEERPMARSTRGTNLASMSYAPDEESAIPANLSLAAMADQNRNRIIADKAYQQQQQQEAIDAMKRGYQEQVLASGLPPPDATIQTETDNANGQPTAYSLRPARAMSDEERIQRSLPPEARPGYLSKLAQQKLAEREVGAKEVEAGARQTAADAAQAAADPSNPKRQQALEQQYRGVIQRTLSSRSGGMGLEDQKVNQALHLVALMDQNRDPKTGEYNIPKAQYAELASGLATLVSPTGRPTDSMRNEIETRTAKGDLAGLVTYLTGTPVTGSTQDIFKYLRESIDRQGKTAEANREGYFDAIRAMAPTDLTDERRAALEKSLKLNTLGGGDKSADGDTIYAQDPQGNIHAGKKGAALPQGWKLTTKPGGGR